MPTFRTAYGPKARAIVTFKGPGQTRQAHKEECDINLIMKRYERTGIADHLARHEGRYGDFAAIDYHEALTAVAEAQSMFQTIPAAIRARFDNDPGAFIAFATDEANAAELQELGLARPPAAAPSAAPAASEAPPAPSPTPPGTPSEPGGPDSSS